MSSISKCSILTSHRNTYHSLRSIAPVDVLRSFISNFDLDVEQDNEEDNKLNAIKDKKQTSSYRYIDCHLVNGYTVTYSRTAGLSEPEVKRLLEHYRAQIDMYNGNLVSPADIRKRMSQHYTDYEIYIRSAINSKRSLTEHEQAKQNSTKMAETARVAHIIANVTVQCMLNRMTMQFLSGSNAVTENMHGLLKAQKQLAYSEKRLLQAMKAADSSSSDELIIARRGSYDQNFECLLKKAKPVIAALASQTAAIARMRGIGRAIIHEEADGEGYGEIIQDTGSVEKNIFNKRQKMANDLNVAFGNVTSNAINADFHIQQGRSRSQSDQSEKRTDRSQAWQQVRRRSYSTNDVDWSNPASEDRLRAYINYLRHTVDSVGNLRLGDTAGNSQIGAGFDMPLTSDLQPTKRGERLLNAIHTYGLPELVTPGVHGEGNATYTTGIFSTDSQGHYLSSSLQPAE